MGNSNSPVTVHRIQAILEKQPNISITNIGKLLDISRQRVQQVVSKHSLRDSNYTANLSKECLVCGKIYKLSARVLIRITVPSNYCTRRCYLDAIYTRICTGCGITFVRDKSRIMTNRRNDMRAVTNWNHYHSRQCFFNRSRSKI
jgi:hypothetical protein